jgi:hypothetical protein
MAWPGLLAEQVSRICSSGKRKVLIAVTGRAWSIEFVGPLFLSA